MLDELISLCNSATNEHRVAHKEKTERAAAESLKAQDMRQQSLESLVTHNKARVKGKVQALWS